MSDEKKKQEPKMGTFLFGSRGGYASTDPIVGKVKSLKFGEKIQLADADYKKLPKVLRDQLVPESKWAAHKKKIFNPQGLK